MKREQIWLLASGLLVLLVLNGLIVQKERILTRGKTVYLELAPRDPRSLMQGDYMVLRYRIADEASAALPTNSVQQGKLVIHCDEKGVGRFVRIHDGAPLAEGERLLRFASRRGQLQLGAESFFFEEGQSASFETARYGKLALAPDGTSILLGLADEQLRPLGPKP